VLSPQQPTPDLIVRVGSVHDRQDFVPQAYQPNYLVHVHRPPSQAASQSSQSDTVRLETMPGDVPAELEIAMPPAVVCRATTKKGSSSELIQNMTEGGMRPAAPWLSNRTPQGHVISVPGAIECPTVSQVKLSKARKLRLARPAALSKKKAPNVGGVS
jgi:hypothetical protein